MNGGLALKPHFTFYSSFLSFKHIKQYAKTTQIIKTISRIYQQVLIHYVIAGLEPQVQIRQPM